MPTEIGSDAMGLNAAFSLSSSFPVLQTSLSPPSTTNRRYQTGLITIGFCTLAFASMSPITKWVLSGEQEISVLVLNAMTSTLAFFLFGSEVLIWKPFLWSDDGAASTKREDNSNNDAWKGGLELGVWKSLGTTANLYSLSMTTADH